MTKQEFISQLKSSLSGLPDNDIEERLSFYEEMVDDRIEEGLSEEDAVAQIGSVDEVVSQILSDTSIVKLVKEKISPKRKMRVWEIILLILGSPIWLSILIALFAVVLSVYIVLWALILTIWVVGAAFAVSAPAAVIVGIFFICSGDTVAGLSMISAAFVCAGLAIFTIIASKAATIGAARLTKKITTGLKRCFIKEESKWKNG